MPLSLTIVICTHNRADLLGRTLFHINEASRPERTRISILVVANACSDHTAEVLTKYETERNERDWLDLVWVSESSQGKSNALNCAIPMVTSDIIAFVDDDHRVDEKYFLGIADAAKSYPQATMFCGRIIPDWDGREPPWVHDKGPYRIYPLPVPRFDKGDQPYEIQSGGAVPGGGNLFLRREVFDRVGRFCTTFGPRGHNLGGGEDSDFVLRALRAGERIQYVPDVLQYHYVDLNRLRLGYLIRKGFQRSRVTSRLNAEPGMRIPLYMWRKLGLNVMRGLASYDQQKFRFYLVRSAATLGEMKGVIDARTFSKAE